MKRAAATSASALFDAAFLQRLRLLFIQLRRRRMLRQKGVQPTHAHGFTREFKDYRPYARGDDFRAIDWRLFARTERLFVKLYEEIQAFHVHILIDCSASMLRPHPRKRATTLRLAAALAYLGLVNQHRVSLLSFADDIRQELPPLKGQGHIHRVLRHLAAMPFEGATNLNALNRFRPARERRGVVFLLSDLLGRQPEDAAAALEVATSWPAETHVVHLLEPEEIRPGLRPELLGDVALVDAETGERQRMQLTQGDLDAYEHAFERFLERLARACLRRHVDYLTWRTDRGFEEGFLAFLARGNALARG